jgi:hypothetical protein
MSKQPLTIDEENDIAGILYRVYTQTVYLVEDAGRHLGKTHRSIVRMRRAAQKLQTARSRLNFHCNPRTECARWDTDCSLTLCAHLDNLAFTTWGVLRRLYHALPVSCTAVKNLLRARELLRWARVPFLYGECVSFATGNLQNSGVLPS